MEYSNQDVLVSTDWVSEHLNDEKTRIVEVDYDPKPNYFLGHIPGSVLIDWKKEINNQLTRNIIGKDACTELLQKAGVNEDTTLVLYGDFNNWFAAFAFWVFDYHGKKNLKLMNGGRKKWLDEDRSITKDVVSYKRGNFASTSPNTNIRVFLNEVKNKIENNNVVLVDVRSNKEFTGEITAPAEYPTEHAQRGGHIPGAHNIPWSMAVNDDGTFKSADELSSLYTSNDILSDKEVITYCRIGERSSHTWFVLKYLLGYANVKNYDGSWTEWGNMIDNPIEK